MDPLQPFIIWRDIDAIFTTGCSKIGNLTPNIFTEYHADSNSKKQNILFHR